MGNRAGGFWGREREGRSGEHLGAERTWRLAVRLVWPVCAGRDKWLSITRPPLAID